MAIRFLWLIVGVAGLWQGGLIGGPVLAQQGVPEKKLPLAGEVFAVGGRPAFLIAGREGLQKSGKAWVWYAPTLPGLPGVEETWMFRQFQEAGIAIAGIDAGESFGSPAGCECYDQLHAEMVRRGFSSRPVLLGRSRGGLMTLSRAARNPQHVSAFAGIYPVCSLTSYPGLQRASAAFAMTAEELGRRLEEFDPVNRLAPLAEAGVPMFAIHGDVDTVVPLEANSGLAAERYRAAGGQFQLIVPAGQGHNMWSGFFECQELVDFVVRTAAPVTPMIGFTKLRTDLPGGRHANVRTSRAMLMQADGSHLRELGSQLLVEDDVETAAGHGVSNSWTQFAGWSPDGTQAIVNRGWQHPQNAEWEEQQRTFRMEPGRWSLDASLVSLADGVADRVTAVERVSHYNSGLFFLPEKRGFGFTALIDGVSRPFVMQPDGRGKRDVSGGGTGFSYGYSASPDGSHISYHEDYQVYIANADGSSRQKIETGNPFNFAPQWSPDGKWLLFVSGQHGKANPWIVQADGTGLRQLADLGGYQGWVLFLDVLDFHQGSSDLPVWSVDGRVVYCSRQCEDRVELFEVTLSGEAKQLTSSESGTLHYHPTPSPDGQWLLYGSKRGGVRNLFVRSLQDGSERQVTTFSVGTAAMWPHWQKSVK